MNRKLRFMNTKLDELVKSPKTVIPAKAGIHKWLNSLDYEH